MTDVVWKKKIKKIKESELPIDNSFTKYYSDENARIRRDYEFFLVDDKYIYLRDEQDEPLLFWGVSNCAGIGCYVEKNYHEIQFPEVTVMCVCGCDSFHIRYGSYECMGVCPICKKVYSLYGG